MTNDEERVTFELTMEELRYLLGILWGWYSWATKVPNVDTSKDGEKFFQDLYNKFAQKLEAQDDGRPLAQISEDTRD